MVHRRATKSSHLVERASSQVKGIRSILVAVISDSMGERESKYMTMITRKRASLSPGLLARSLVRRVCDDSLLRNSIYLMGTTVVLGALGYVFWIVAARMYSAHDVGLASAFIGAMTLASALSNLGMGTTLVQELPRREAGFPWSLAVNAGLATGALTGLVIGSIVAIVLPLLSRQFAVAGQQVTYAIALIIGVPLWTVAGLMDSVFVAERAAGNMLLRNATYALLRIPLLVLPLLLGHAVALTIFSSWVLAAGATAIGGVLLLIPRLGRDYRMAMRGVAKQGRSLLSSSAGNFLTYLGWLAPIWLLPVVVAARLSPTANAYFYTTWQVGYLFFMVSPAVANSLFAEGSHAPDRILHKVRSSALIIALLLGLAMPVALLGGRYVMMLFGPSYADHAHLLLIILVASAVPDAITNICVSVLLVQGRSGRAASLNLGMAALALALAWALLPVLGIAGAGWGWLIAQTVGALAVGAYVIAAGIGRRVTRWEGDMQ